MRKRMEEGEREQKKRRRNERARFEGRARTFARVYRWYFGFGSARAAHFWEWSSKNSGGKSFLPGKLPLYFPLLLCRCSALALLSRFKLIIRTCHPKTPTVASTTLQKLSLSLSLSLTLLSQYMHICIYMCTRLSLTLSLYLSHCSSLACALPILNNLRFSIISLFELLVNHFFHLRLPLDRKYTIERTILQNPSRIIDLRNFEKLFPIPKKISLRKRFLSTKFAHELENLTMIYESRTLTLITNYFWENDKIHVVGFFENDDLRFFRLCESMSFFLRVLLITSNYVSAQLFSVTARCHKIALELKEIKKRHAMVDRVKR